MRRRPLPLTPAPAPARHRGGVSVHLTVADMQSIVRRRRDEVPRGRRSLPARRRFVGRCQATGAAVAQLIGTRTSIFSGVTPTVVRGSQPPTVSVTEGVHRITLFLV